MDRILTLACVAYHGSERFYISTWELQTWESSIERSVRKIAANGSTRKNFMLHPTNERAL